MDPELKKLLEELAAAQKAVADKQVEATKGLEAARNEIKEHGAVAAETKNKTQEAFAELTKLQNELKELGKTAKERMDGLEAAMNRPSQGAKVEPVKSIGRQFVESDQYKASRKSGSRTIDMVELKSITRGETKDAVPSGATVELSTTGVALTGPGEFVPAPIMMPQRKPLLRDILGSRTTEKDIVWFCQETGFAVLYTTTTAIANIGAATIVVKNPNGFYVNADHPQQIWINGELKTVTSVTSATNTIGFTPVMIASAPSGSPVVANDFASTAEGMTKPDSQIEFTPLPVYVKTIAATLTVSNQLLADAPGLEAVLNQKLPYAMLLSEEKQMLYGDEWNDTTQLPGIFNQPSLQHYLWSSGVVSDTQFDAIRHGIALAELAEYEVDFVLINTSDLCNLELIKDSTGQYIAKEIIKTNPDGSQTIWGKRMLRTNAVAAGHVLIGSMMAASVVDRELANIRIFEQHEDYAKRNLVLIRGEERIGLEVGRPEAFVDVELDHAPVASS